MGQAMAVVLATVTNGRFRLSLVDLQAMRMNNRAAIMEREKRRGQLGAMRELTVFRSFLVVGME